MFNTDEQVEETGFTKDGLSKKWGWYNTIYMLANENFLNIEKVVKKPAYECFNFMNYKQDVNQKIKDEHRRNKI